VAAVKLPFERLLVSVRRRIVWLVCRHGIDLDGVGVDGSTTP